MLIIEYLRLNISWFLINVGTGSWRLKSHWGHREGAAVFPHFSDQEKQTRRSGLKSLQVRRFSQISRLGPAVGHLALILFLFSLKVESNGDYGPSCLGWDTGSKLTSCVTLAKPSVPQFSV